MKFVSLISYPQFNSLTKSSLFIYKQCFLKQLMLSFFITPIYKLEVGSFIYCFPKLCLYLNFKETTVAHIVKVKHFKGCFHLFDELYIFRLIYSVSFFTWVMSTTKKSPQVITMTVLYKFFDVIYIENCKRINLVTYIIKIHLYLQLYNLKEL